jgi:hypothetical protein
MAYRDTASFGKRQEYSVVAQLLRRGFDVYMTLVDDQGIDCVVRLDERRYLDIQIKARSCDAKQWNFFAAMSFTPRRNLYFIFYTERNDSYWVIPSQEVAKLGVYNKTGKNAGKVSLALPKTDQGIKPGRFAKYLNAFDLLNRHRKNKTVKRNHR